jgi:pyruvate formate lyase activating enzyme
MEACLYESLKNLKVQCRLCNHRCVISTGQRGKCGVRENQDGILKTLVYGRLITGQTGPGNVDPIEKKPFFHFMPGSLSYSIATVGCNFSCLFCQNAHISQMPSDQQGKIAGTIYSAASVLDAAQQTGCKSIAYTYTEPTVFFEFALDTAKLARQRGLRNVFVTNGYMTPEALKTIRPYLDAANVDLKAFREKFYKDVCGASLKPVMKTLGLMKSMGIHLEITTMLIPGMNDDPVELSKMASFIATDLGPETPWHISRFHPTYKLNELPPTPVNTLVNAREIGIRAGLQYVYTGNVPGDSGENTYCHHCGKQLIERWGFNIRKNRIRDGRCAFCKTIIPGIEMSGQRIEGVDDKR